MDQKLSSIQEEITQLKLENKKTKGDVNTLKDEVEILKEGMKMVSPESVNKKIRELQNQINNQEQHSRNSCIRISGVPISKELHDNKKLCEFLYENYLKELIFKSLPPHEQTGNWRKYIANAHPLYAPNGKNPSIILRCYSRITTINILKNKKIIQDKKIYIYQEVTKENSKKM